jgi:hypothetical protein
MDHLEVSAGAVFTVDAFGLDDILLLLGITHRYLSILFQYTTLYICHPSLYFSPVKVNKT